MHTHHLADPCPESPQPPHHVPREARQPDLGSLSPKTRTARWALLGAAVAVGLLGACAPTTRPALRPTGGMVRFAPSKRAFWKKRWITRVRANAPRICAGFVHRERFERYLKYGHFELEMILQVFKGGAPVRTGSHITGWQGGSLLRTLRKRRKVSPSNDAYVWCGRLRKGGLWKVGAMRFVFTLRASERSMDERLARGVLLVTP